MASAKGKTQGGRYAAKRSGKNDEELERSYQHMTGSRKKKKSNPTVAICIIAAVVLILLLVVGSLVLWQMSPKYLGDVTAANVCLKGMTPEEAKAALLAATQDTYTKNAMVIDVDGYTTELTPAQTGASLDVDGVVAAARKLPAGSGQVMDILPYLTLNTDVIRQTVDTLGQKFNTEYADATYTLEGEKPEPLEPDAACQTLVIQMGTPGYRLDTTVLYNQILAAYSTNTFHVAAEYSVQNPELPDLNAIHDETCTEAVDAVMDPETFAISEEAYGYGFDLEAAAAALESAQPGETVKIPFSVIAPETTAESLKGTLFQDELAAFSSQHASDNNRATNLRLACEAINGLVLNPGEVFSFNDTVGERTTEKGYKPGATYVGGNSVNTIGGGICQVASTIYYCCLLSDMEIVDRDCHMYPADYVPWGMDATISWGTLDFKFRNSSNYPLRIDAEYSDGKVHIHLMGTDDKDYYVKMEYEVVRSYDYETEYQEMSADNPKGYKDGDVITSPITGYYVETYRCKYNKQTDELISREYEDGSRYSARNKVVCRIVGQTQPEPTEPPTEPIPGSGGGISQDPGD